jgi:two-component system response regulator AtoC
MVVDDDPSVCDFLETFLRGLGYNPITLTTATDAVRRYDAERPAAVILDILLPGGVDGLTALTTMMEIDRTVPVIVISGEARTPTVVRAMKLGAFDFMSKPFDESDLELLLARAIHTRQRPQQPIPQARIPHDPQALLGSRSPSMQAIHELVRRVADTDVTVLVRGESGTGKELVARAIHASSLRRTKPFVKVNCAALPNDLLESELFGFERGAFTGAVRDKPGKFEFANHGTIFLDEIGDMSFPLQAKLLQVLQDGEFTRLGGRQDVQVDVRVIAATNRNLEEAVGDRQFREDLFFRLNVVTMDLPPLRERREEIPALTELFLEKYSAQYRRPLTAVSPEVMALFMQHTWPGNVRELENLVKRIVVLGSDAQVRQEIALAPTIPHGSARDRVAGGAPVAAAPPAQMPGNGNGHGHGEGGPVAEPGRRRSLKEVSREAARDAETKLILSTLERTRWNRKQAAHLLGISYKALLYKIKDSGMDQTVQQ